MQANAQGHRVSTSVVEPHRLTSESTRQEDLFGRGRWTRTWGRTMCWANIKGRRKEGRSKNWQDLTAHQISGKSGKLQGGKTPEVTQYVPRGTILPFRSAGPEWVRRAKGGFRWQNSPYCPVHASTWAVESRLWTVARQSVTTREIEHSLN